MNGGNNWPLFNCLQSPREEKRKEEDDGELSTLQKPSQTSCIHINHQKRSIMPVLLAPAPLMAAILKVIYNARNTVQFGGG